MFLVLNSISMLAIIWVGRIVFGLLTTILQDDTERAQIGVSDEARFCFKSQGIKTLDQRLWREDN
jgi:hypothetical protein